jgi:dipeptidyl aminopeptidase/acylaminoacyl peptidase
MRRRLLAATLLLAGSAFGVPGRIAAQGPSPAEASAKLRLAAAAPAIRTPPAPARNLVALPDSVVARRKDYTVTGELVIDPAVSPDGTKVAFGRVLPTVPSTTDLYVINIDGTGERLLLHGEAYHSNPSWSPDGSKIVFAQDLPSGLFIIDASGGDPSTLVLNPSSIAWPTWTW